MNLEKDVSPTGLYNYLPKAQTTRRRRPKPGKPRKPGKPGKPGKPRKPGTFRLRRKYGLKKSS
jgi:hypothetical protein